MRWKDKVNSQFLVAVSVSCTTWWVTTWEASILQRYNWPFFREKRSEIQQIGVTFRSCSNRLTSSASSKHHLPTCPPLGAAGRLSQLLSWQLLLCPSGKHLVISQARGYHPKDTYRLAFATSLPTPVWFHTLQALRPPPASCYAKTELARTMPKTHWNACWLCSDILISDQGWKPTRYQLSSYCSPAVPYWVTLLNIFFPTPSLTALISLQPHHTAVAVLMSPCSHHPLRCCW